MQLLKKPAAIALCILLAAALSACSGNESPETDYSGISEIGIDDFLSEISEEKPKNTQWEETAKSSENAEDTGGGMTETDKPGTDTALETENTESDENAENKHSTPPQNTESAQGQPDAAPDPDRIYKEDKLLSTRFSEEEINYLHGCAFLGDSTCLGYCRYGLIEDARVFGNGGVAARNIHTHTFVQKGKEVDYVTALKNTGCRELYFLMGMNDVRIISAEDYKKFYGDMLNTVRKALPDANIHILSVTPITEYSDFYPNERLSLLNDKLKEISAEEGCIFIDTASAVKNEKGFLKDDLCSGDGIHMTPEAYFLMLRVILDSAGF